MNNNAKIMYNPAFFSNIDTQILEARLLADLREDMSRGTPDFQVCGYVCDVMKFHNNIFPYHWHDELQFTVAVDHPLELCINGETVIVSPGQMIFLNSRVMHSVGSLELGHCQRNDIIFKTSVIADSFNSAVYKNYLLPLISRRDLPYVLFTRDDASGSGFGAKAMGLFEEAFSALENQPYGFEITVRDKLSQILLMISAEHALTQEVSSGLMDLREKRVRAMAGFIYRHFSEPITVHQIASSAAVSQRECYRAFQDVLNTTPIEFLRQHRISAAMVYLKDPSLDISDIAERCGFTDPAYFSRTFKALTSITPGVYRKKSG